MSNQIKLNVGSRCESLPHLIHRGHRVVPKLFSSSLRDHRPSPRTDRGAKLLLNPSRPHLDALITLNMGTIPEQC